MAADTSSAVVQIGPRYEPKVDEPICHRRRRRQAGDPRPSPWDHRAHRLLADRRRAREEKHQHTDKYMAMVGLSAARDKKPAQLSGGMRHRVALARALAVGPAILPMDEPLSALDALTRATLQEEFARIHRKSGATMVMVTNDVDEAVLLADRIVPLSAGPQATLGPSFHVDIERPRDRPVAASRPCSPWWRGSLRLVGLGDALDVRPAELSAGMRQRVGLRGG
jgi:nitrate/nitrite transport system ATP-binding protein